MKKYRVEFTFEIEIEAENVAMVKKFLDSAMGPKLVFPRSVTHKDARGQDWTIRSKILRRSVKGPWRDERT
jgi:hypothetical protein